MREFGYTIYPEQEHSFSLRKGLYTRCVDVSNYAEFLEDLQQVARLQQEEMGWESGSLLTDQIERFNNGNVLYIVYERGQPLGLVWFYQNYICDIFISSRRLRHDSEKILKAVIYSYNHPAAQYAVHAIVPEDEKRTSRFFQKFDGRIFEYYQD